MVEPFHSDDSTKVQYNLIGKWFGSNSPYDWYCLLHDVKEFSRLGDGLALGPLAIALDRFPIAVSTIQSALNSFLKEEITLLLDYIDSVSWSLSYGKMEQLKELARRFGRNCPAVYPYNLTVAAKQCNISCNDLSVHVLTDKLISHYQDSPVANPTGFLRLLKWLDDDEMSLSLEEVARCFPYVGEELRGKIIRRYFYDVKRGVLRYDRSVERLFLSANYEYYSLYRYLYEKWPADRNVQTEFLLDCLDTYEITRQQSFQITNGILDWAIQKAIKVRRPIELNFKEWLCFCEGGVLIKREFKGFAEFEIQYELDDLYFEEESLQASISQLIRLYCTQLYHEDEIPVIDELTQQPLVHERTGRPMTRRVRVPEQRWRVNNDSYKEYIDLFVNWDRKGEEIAGVFNTEMIDPSIVRERVADYMLRHYDSVSPYLSIRKSDPVVKMFGMPVRMRAEINHSVRLGVSPGVELHDIVNRVEQQLKLHFGESLECEYDPELLRQAQTDSQYSTWNQEECFECRAKWFNRNQELYCAPRLSDYSNQLTGRKVAICQGNDMCFVTSIKAEPEWRKYKLVHILGIIGYPVLEETEAGYIPSQVYNQFVNQINRAVRFYRRLVCKDCGHILFPSRNNSYSHFRCLLQTCPQYNVEVYLNYCYECKRGIIDSRDTKKCPNGLYICPDPACGACCSDEFFKREATKKQRQGLRVPARISRYIGHGHNNVHMYFCPKCGAQKQWYTDPEGHQGWRCFTCNPVVEELPPEEQQDIGPDDVYA
jgi:hypothetical protein